MRNRVEEGSYPDGWRMAWAVTSLTRRCWPSLTTKGQQNLSGTTWHVPCRLRNRCRYHSGTEILNTLGKTSTSKVEMLESSQVPEATRPQQRWPHRSTYAHNNLTCELALMNASEAPNQPKIAQRDLEHTDAGRKP